jgi:N-acetyl-1-D-myo-inositol-2-amino-2-deoxy-alpha-D-glucopyranoside deacetylase
MPGRTLLAVHAHPDDECLGTGGILAKYSAEGVRTVLITCTDGAVGEISDPALARPENLAEVRARELDEAVRILDISRSVRLGYRDSGMAGTPDNHHPASLAQADLASVVQKVLQVIEEEQPQVVVTYDERGGYGHPDHIRAHQVAVAAVEASKRSPKLYYTVFPRSAARQFMERVRAAGIEVPWDPEATEFGVPDERITTAVDVSAYVSQKRRALEAHRTQMGENMFFMRLPPDLFAEAFGRETFQRVRGPGGLPEGDLFEGL